MTNLNLIIDPMEANQLLIDLKRQQSAEFRRHLIARFVPIFKFLGYYGLLAAAFGGAIWLLFQVSGCGFTPNMVGSTAAEPPQQTFICQRPAGKPQIVMNCVWSASGVQRPMVWDCQGAPPPDTAVCEGVPVEERWIDAAKPAAQFKFVVRQPMKVWWQAGHTFVDPRTYALYPGFKPIVEWP